MFFPLFGVSSAYRLDDLLFWGIWAFFTLSGMWLVFSKAGYRGWGAIIPVYNVYIMLKIAGRPGSWLVLLLIPFANIAMLLRLAVDMATVFGRSAVFGFVGLFLFPFAGYLILGLGDASYIGY